MTTPVTASIELALTVAVRGYYQPGEPITRDDPGCDAEVEDVEIEGLSVELVDAWVRDGRPVRTTRTIDILAGVDRTSAAYRQIEANIIAALGDDAHEALTDDHLRSAA